MTADIERVRSKVENGASRRDLLELLPACGARNALDCALWELEAELAGVPVWRLAGFGAASASDHRPSPRGAASPEQMAAKAVSFAGGPRDQDEADRRARP